MQLALLLYGGNLVFAIPIAWFEGELVFYLVYTLSYLHRNAFHSYLPNLPIASLIMCHTQKFQILKGD
jgi:hypothetical protein